MRSKFTEAERLDIGRRIYEKYMNREEAAVVYGINPYTARDYLRMYKATLARSQCDAQLVRPVAEDTAVCMDLTVRENRSRWNPVPPANKAEEELKC